MLMNVTTGLINLFIGILRISLSWMGSTIPWLTRVDSIIATWPHLEVLIATLELIQVSIREVTPSHTMGAGGATVF